MFSSDWFQLRYFTKDEFTQPERMDFDFLRALDEARDRAGLPFKITSSYRDDDLRSPHASGKAVDIQALHSYVRFRIVKSLFSVGFTRIGVYDRHVHVDTDGPPNVLWTGESK